MFKTLKRTYVKVGDIAQNTESGVIGVVEFIAIIDGESYAIWTLLNDKGFLTNHHVLVKAKKLRAGHYRKDTKE